MVSTRSISKHETARKIESSETMAGVSTSYAIVTVLALAPYVVNVPVFVQLVPISILLLYIGCHIGLRNTHRPGASSETERIEAKDAYKFPVFGSFALVSLYLAYKFLPPYYLNIVVSGYFFLVGLLALSSSLKTFYSTTVSLETFEAQNKPLIEFRVPALLAKLLCDSEKKDDDLVQISKIDLPCGVLSAISATVYLLSRHALANNLFGYAFSIQAISLISLDSFWAGAALLLGLFFYDIFFVFATDVMVTVATKFDAPIKLLFPRGGDLRPSMLGLGDIVIPGLFISLMLRIDHDLHCQSKSAKHFAKPYFKSACIGYLIGIATTLYIMYAFEHAQPALLYLVPGCLISVLVCGLARGELKYLTTFKDHPVVDHAHDE